MARYENLPIYRKAVELVVLLENAVRDFPRYHKYALGADLRNQARELAVLVIAANSRRDKVPVLTRYGIRVKK
ncbi:MAG: four helix bundle protein [Proteobacteria bacterium]|nr:four helix bundle protein [Pseudomonadota bacterium]MBU1717015.1 four helix bundle protein [Pseudomonadota bacterium]